MIKFETWHINKKKKKIVHHNQNPLFNLFHFIIYY